MARAFYRLPIAAWEAAGAERSSPRPADCVEVSRSTTQVYLLSATDPSQAIYDAGGERLGARLSEIDSRARKQFTHVLIGREETGPDGQSETVQRMMPSTDLERSDTVIGEPTMRLIFAGDDPADYL